MSFFVWGWERCTLDPNLNLQWQRFCFSPFQAGNSFRFSFSVIVCGVLFINLFVITYSLSSNWLWLFLIYNFSPFYNPGATKIITDFNHSGGPNQEHNLHEVSILLFALANYLCRIANAKIHKPTSADPPYCVLDTFIPYSTEEKRFSINGFPFSIKDTISRIVYINRFFRI